MSTAEINYRDKREELEEEYQNCEISDEDYYYELNKMVSSWALDELDTAFEAIPGSNNFNTAIRTVWYDCLCETDDILLDQDLIFDRLQILLESYYKTNSSNYFKEKFKQCNKQYKEDSSYIIPRLLDDLIPHLLKDNERIEEEKNEENIVCTFWNLKIF